jgi:ribonuclease BN (tRNA processing enzyme)
VSVQITVLGKSPSWPDANGACSGYLVQEGGFTLLLDCGGGVFAKLRGLIDYLDVDAVVISHLHSDHFFDLVPFSYALLHSPRCRAGGGPRPDLHAPPGAQRVFRTTVGSWGDEALIETAFALSEYDPAAELSVGPLRVRFCEVPHFTQTFSVQLRAGDACFTFGADCGPNQALVEFARDSDLLLIEATLTEPEPEGDRGHLTAREAGEHGRRAGVRRLVITHYTDELEPDQAAAEGAEGFGAPVELAREGAVYTV